MQKIRNIGNIAAISLVMMVFLTACGGKDLTKTDATSVTVKKDGSVINVIFEDFSEGYYNIDELKNMAEDEVNAYNAQNGESKAELTSLEREDSNIKMVMKFASASDYTSFNSEQLMFGTVSELKLSGVNVDTNLVDTNGVPVSSEDIAGILDDQHVLVTENKGLVALPYKVKYTSKGVSLTDSSVADLSQTAEGELTYIVLGK